MKVNQYIGQFLETLDNIDKNHQETAGLIMGSPGCGKTATIAKWCEYKNYNLTTLVPSHYSVDDLLGLQTKSKKEDGTLIRLVPTWFAEMVEKAKNGKRNVLFIDELSGASEFLQTPLFNILSKHSFDDKHLPENTFIVSAGNYSDEMNNAFRLTAPLVNRFLILNIRPEDIDLMDLLDDKDINQITKKKDIEEFLGLESNKSHKFNFDNFKKWVRNNIAEFAISKSEYTDDQELGGLLGFISTRSFKYSMTFAQTYLNQFDDPIWMRICGDTLGMSSTREGQPMRMFLEASSANFTTSAGVPSGFLDVCNYILSNGIDQASLKNLEACVNNASMSTVTAAALQKFGEVCKKYSNRSEIQYLLQKLNSRMDRYS